MKQPPLANAELAIMDLLWQQDRMTARQIREKLYPDEKKAQHGTVQRLLQRLEDKGYISRDRSLGVHLFSAMIEARSCERFKLLSKEIKDPELSKFYHELMTKKVANHADAFAVGRAVTTSHDRPVERCEYGLAPSVGRLDRDRAEEVVQQTFIRSA